MSGPNTICTTCARELSAEYIILESIRYKKITNENINRLIATDQETLLGNDVKEFMDHYKLNDCCRMCLLHAKDISYQIYG